MSDKMMSILIGGVAAAVLATIISLPQNQCLGCLACLCYVGSGLLAVWHYTNTNSLTIKGGEGASIGAMAGVVAGVVGGILGFVFRDLPFSWDWLPDTIWRARWGKSLPRIDPLQRTHTRS